MSKNYNSKPDQTKKFLKKRTTGGNSDQVSESYYIQVEKARRERDTRESQKLLAQNAEENACNIM